MLFGYGKCTLNTNNSRSGIKKGEEGGGLPGECFILFSSTPYEGYRQLEISFVPSWVSAPPPLLAYFLFPNIKFHEARGTKKSWNKGGGRVKNMEA